MGLHDTFSQPQSQLLFTKQRLHSQPFQPINKFAGSRQVYTSHSNSSRLRPRCTQCACIGHTQQVCYRLHGYPSGHKFYKKENTQTSPAITSKTVTHTKDIFS